MDRIKEIDTLKGIAIFFVIVGHAIIRYPINLHDNTICNYIFEIISSVHMPLFFLISGFCFHYEKGTYKIFIQKKIKRIFIPYVAFNILDAIPRLLLPSLINRKKTPMECLSSILFSGGEYWFLYTLFVIFLIYPFFSNLLKGKNEYIILFLLLLAYSYDLFDIQLFLISDVINYLFYFTLGFLIKNLSLNFVNTENKKKLKKILFLLISGILWISSISLLKNKKIVVALLGMIFCVALVKFNSINNIFGRFGIYSLQLYLLNGFILVPSRYMMCNFLKITNPAIIVCFNIFTCLILSYLFIKYVCKKSKIICNIMGM